MTVPKAEMPPAIPREGLLGSPSQWPPGLSPSKQCPEPWQHSHTLTMRRHSTFVNSSRCLHVQELCEKLTSHPLEVRREEKKMAKPQSVNIRNLTKERRPRKKKNLLVEPHSNVGRWQLMQRCEEEQPAWERCQSATALATYSTVTKCESHWASECQYSHLQMGKLKLREVES